MFDISVDWVTQVEGLLQPADLPEAAGVSARAESEPRLASVLIPIFWRNNEWHILFIRRVENNRDRHSGQVAFPGGRRETTDIDEFAVALREAQEEIGLRGADVRVLGKLDDYHTSSNYLVTPVVAIVPWPYPFEPQVSEVGRIFSIPLSWLADRAHVELRDRVFKIPESPASMELKVVYFDRYDEEVLWGATARMTISFLKALHDGRFLHDLNRDQLSG